MSKRVSKSKGQKRGPKNIPAGIRAMAVLEMSQGTNVSALAKRIGVHRSVLYEWAKAAAEDLKPAVAPMQPEEYKMSQLRLRIVELEAAVGRKQNQIDFFQGALQRVAALGESSRANGVKPSTAKSGRSSCKAK
jgi:transposase-like protein